MHREVKNFIYLDMEKVGSLYSQFFDGIVQTLETAATHTGSSKNIRNYDFKVFKHTAGGDETDSQQMKETRVAHHELYNELEQKLHETGLSCEIGKDITRDDVRTGKALKIFENALCIKVSGDLVLEDYQRLTRISERYFDIGEFIDNSIQSNLKESEAYREAFESIEALKQQASDMKNGAPKRNIQHKIKQQQHNMDALLSKAQMDKVEPWVIEGLKTWIEVFYPNLFSIRVYPFEDLDNFHVLGNLKRECILDQDSESLHFLYGSIPTVKLTVLGILTSVPNKGPNLFDPMKEFHDECIESAGSDNDAAAFEGAFRGVFRGFDGLEDMTRSSRFPRITIQPIAIYRSVTPKGHDNSQ